MTQTNKLIKWFKLIAIITLIWNFFGVMSYLMHAYMTPETLATLPENQQNFMNNMPSWRVAAFATATFGGLVGSILLLMKKKIAIALFLLSLIGIIAGNIYDFFMVNYYKNSDITGLILPVLIVLVSVFLLWYSKKIDSNGMLK